MKKIFFFLTLITGTILEARISSAITYDHLGGRLGDRLIKYCKAKLIAYKYQIPLLYKPFQHSNQLMMHKKEIWHTNTMENQFDRLVKIKHEKDIQVKPSKSTLYISTYYLELNNDDLDFTANNNIELNIEKLLIYIMKKTSFARQLNQMIKPINSLDTVRLPKDKITVALHVRKGSSGDRPLVSQQQYGGHHHLVQYHTQEYPFNERVYSDERWPCKFPPDQYYIDQIKKMSKMFDNKPMYVYLFTDAKSPQSLRDKYKKAVGRKNITFACRKDNNCRTRILNDLFSMAQFDCLIRSTSNFGRSAQIIGNHKVIICPQHARWVGKKVVVDTVSIIRRDYATSRVYVIHEPC